MKPPLTYYGGKQMLSKLIVSLIPKHNLYCEPFFGGGAVFFAKEPSNIEAINDNNGELINFYKVLKSQFKKLNKEIQYTLHSRESHQNARIVLEHPHLFDEVKRAWAIWTVANQSYASKLNGSWGYGRKENRTANQLHQKRISFTDEFAKRLEKTEIECEDAIEVICSRDCKESFFYCDPPYFGTNLGHYKRYTKEDFEKLLKVLSNIKGKFLLSSYPSELLSKYTKQNKWFTRKIGTSLSLANNTNTKVKRKIEVLTSNYRYDNSESLRKNSED
jgi:DNA adenine methylase